jgi:hypothetical protein
LTLLQLSYADYPDLVGHRLRIRKDGETYEGTMIGVNSNSHVATGQITNVAPWILLLRDGTTRHFIPGPWDIYDQEAGYFTD